MAEDAVLVAIGNLNLAEDWAVSSLNYTYSDNYSKLLNP